VMLPTIHLHPDTPLEILHLICSHSRITNHHTSVSLTYVPLGATATLTYTTAGLVTSKVELDNLVADGVKAEVISNFSPKEGFNKGQKINLHFKQGILHGRVFGDYTPSSGNMTATVDAVVTHEGFLAGAEAAYDVQKATLTRHGLGLGYQTGLYTVAATGTNNLTILNMLYYHKVNSAVEASVRASYDVKEGKPAGIEIASKYQVDPLSFVKVLHFSFLSIYSFGNRHHTVRKVLSEC